jgi:hypothetical protein
MTLRTGTLALQTFVARRAARQRSVKVAHGRRAIRKLAGGRIECRRTRFDGCRGHAATRQSDLVLADLLESSQNARRFARRQNRAAASGVLRGEVVVACGDPCLEARRRRGLFARRIGTRASVHRAAATEQPPRGRQDPSRNDSACAEALSPHAEGESTRRAGRGRADFGVGESIVWARVRHAAIRTSGRTSTVRPRSLQDRALSGVMSRPGAAEDRIATQRGAS